MPYKDFKTVREAIAFARKKAQTSTTGKRDVTVRNLDTNKVIARFKKSNYHK